MPKRIVTDKLRFYSEAKREIASGLDHWSHKALNERAENSHWPFQKGERSMQGFRTPGGLQRFVSIHSSTRNRFAVPSRRRAALTIRYHRMEAIRCVESGSKPRVIVIIIASNQTMFGLCENSMEACQGNLYTIGASAAGLIATGIWLCSLDGRNAREIRAGNLLVNRGTVQE